MAKESRPITALIVAIPETAGSALYGMFDVLGAAGNNPIAGMPSLEMSESEVGFQAIIDPYARGDFFLSFGEAGVDLEEGYLTFAALPGAF